MIDLLLYLCWTRNSKFRLIIKLKLTSILLKISKTATSWLSRFESIYLYLDKRRELVEKSSKYICKLQTQILRVWQSRTKRNNLQSKYMKMQCDNLKAFSNLTPKPQAVKNEHTLMHWHCLHHHHHRHHSHSDPLQLRQVADWKRRSLLALALSCVPALFHDAYRIVGEAYFSYSVSH